jgi:predicted outer membrane repeat protein
MGCYGSSDALTSCTFSGNTAAVNGGGMDCHSSTLVVTDCTFLGNDAEDGGGILSSESSLAVTNCAFLANTARDHGYEPEPSGGGVSSYGGDVTLASCTFAGNYADFGGGAVACSQGAPALTNCTLSENTSEHGGGVLCVQTSLTLTKCIIAFSGSGGAVRCLDGGSASPSCCDVYENAGGDWVDCLAGQGAINGNLSADPLFCSAGMFDFTLYEDSPCMPGNHPDGSGCGLIGAWGIGCPATGIAENADETSWGVIKAMFR